MGARDGKLGVGTSLQTDRYEFSMAAAMLDSHLADRRCVFEVFARDLPAGRRYGVLAGVDRLVEALDDFVIDAGVLDFLVAGGVLGHKAAEALRGRRFVGDIYALGDGSLYFPNTPVLRVEGSFVEATLIETLVLSMLNGDSSAATTATRMVAAAAGRPLIEMGSRRTNEDDAIAVARAAYIAGFSSTSNLAAGRLYGVPTAGTAAHAFTLAFDSELEAFRSQVAAQGTGTTLLVDTYDIEQGVRNAVEAAGPELGAIRIDCGPLKENVCLARSLLDRLGATQTRIVASGDLDEYVVADLLEQKAPVDGFGIGTKLVSGPSRPAPGFVYKLVAIASADGPDAVLRPTAKRQLGKATDGGRKLPFRRVEDGILVEEGFVGDGEDLPSGTHPIQHLRIFSGGRMDGSGRHVATALARERCRNELATLPVDARGALDPGEPYLVARRFAKAIVA